MNQALKWLYTQWFLVILLGLLFLIIAFTVSAVNDIKRNQPQYDHHVYNGSGPYTITDGSGRKLATFDDNLDLYVQKAQPR